MKPAIAIMTMNHPDSKTIERLVPVSLPKFLFVRKFQYKDYKKWEKKSYNVIVLPEYIEEAGMTRAYMMEYLNENGYSWAFQLDDDVDYLGVIEQRENGQWKWEYTNKPEKVYFKTKVFQMWYKLAKKYGLSLSAPNHRFHDYRRHGLSMLINKAACIQCVLVYIPDVLAVGNYRDTRVYGVDDYALQYFLMSSGYKCAMLNMFEYGSPAIGNPNDKQGTIDKYKRYIKLFKKNICDDPGLITVKQTRSGVPSIQFIWKNWGGYKLETPNCFKGGGE